ncbi:MAG: SDR family oxidoreductase [Candidatus Azambacteria bacterium]|nr:SDR family oxidoreductase [Candidatus Azambacteria bacterium]
MNQTAKKILVTGGAGYIGCVLVPKLLKRGYQVRVLDKMVFGDEPIKEFKDKIDLIVGDSRYVGPEIVDGIDAVIHLAGFSTDPTSQYDPRLTDMINHIATEHLAKLARAEGIKRLVYASSCSVYFTLNTPLEPPLYKEDDPINPISAYSLSKRCSEQALLGMTGDDFQPTMFRKGTLYGWSPRMRYDLVFNAFVKDAFNKKLLTVDAGGEIWRPMIDIQDATDAYINAIELPLEKIGGKIFNVAHQNWSIGNLAKEIKKILKEKKEINIELDIKPISLTRNYKADTSAFNEAFGFKPSRSFEEAVLEIWNHLENDKEHNSNDAIYYGDKWYKRYFEAEEGKKFRLHI